MSDTLVTQYPYEPSPLDGWDDTATAARMWVKRWVETQSTWRVDHVVSCVRGGPGWLVEVALVQCDCDVCERATSGHDRLPA